MYLLFHDSERLGREFKLFTDLEQAQLAFLEYVEPGKKATRVSRAKFLERAMPRYEDLGNLGKWRHWESAPLTDAGGEETTLQPIAVEA